MAFLCELFQNIQTQPSKKVSMSNVIKKRNRLLNSFSEE